MKKSKEEMDAFKNALQEWKDREKKVQEEEDT